MVENALLVNAHLYACGTSENTIFLLIYNEHWGANIYDNSFSIVSSIKNSRRENSDFDTVPFRPLLNVVAALEVTGTVYSLPKILLQTSKPKTLPT